MTLERALELLSLPRLVGPHPDDGEPVEAAIGRFGPYVEMGEAKEAKRASLPKGWPPADMDIDKALRLLSLPREVGNHPDEGGMILAGIGRYGPYVQHNGTYANLPTADEVFEVGINRAVDVLAEKRAGKGAGGRAPAPWPSWAHTPPMASRSACSPAASAPTSSTAPPTPMSPAEPTPRT